MITIPQIFTREWFANGIPSANKTAPWQVPNYDGYKMYPDDTGTIHYKLNSLGYRDVEWTDDDIDNSIWCVGASDVVGVGVKNEESWCRQLEKLSGKKTINLGINGASWDTISRLVNSATQKYKPTAIIIMSSTEERREFVNQDIQTIVLPFLPKDKMPYKDFYKHIDDLTNQYNVEKNLNLIKLSCETKNIKHHIFDITDRWTLIKECPAVDNMHLGPKLHKHIAEELVVWIENNV